MRFASFVMAVFLAATLAAGTAWSQQEDGNVIRIGILQFGTVSWELDVIQHHNLDERYGFSLDIVPLASNQATTVALLAGDVDMIVSDWLWTSRQRAGGREIDRVGPEALGNQHGDGALDRVENQRRRGQALRPGAKHVGRADIARTDLANVALAGPAGQQQPERD